MTVLVPLPLPGEIDSQLFPLVAVHGHPLLPETVTLPQLPAARTEAALAESPKVPDAPA